MRQYFIWGMGLLGASLGLDLRNRGYHVAGTVRSQKNKSTLEEMGFDHIYTADDEALWEQVKASDGVIIGTPVEYIVDILKEFHTRNVPDHIWVTDMASTKSELMSWVDGFDGALNFVGSHPMAGSDLTGPEHGHEHLFRNATIYVTPSENMRSRLGSEKYQKSVETVISFWKEMESLPFELSYNVHDQWAAYLSHGLHLVSCMVSHLVKDIPGVFNVPGNPAGGSFRDITRVAGSNPVLWDGIIGSNAEEVTKYLYSLEDMVRTWREQLENGTLPIQEIFSESAKIRGDIIKITLPQE
jgi:prephenate dehydrogenase